MTATQDSVSSLQTSVPPALSLGVVALSVADLGRSLDYYRQVIGLEVLEQDTHRVVLGAGGEPLLDLHGQPGAATSVAAHTGLYHLAILLPGRADLGRFAAHLIREQLPVQGASDHHVSEAIYLEDPDGHGIEVYADRSPESWAWQGGQVKMDTRAADIGSIVASAGQDTAWRGVPAGTVMGHVHLKVADLAASRAFYEELLGLDVVADFSAHGALFVSQGGYHHHFGLNVWQSRGGQPAQVGEARLLSASVFLPEAELAALRARLLEAGHPLPATGDTFTVTDPSGNLLRFGRKV
ncbi:VOC family protein [Deinococcus sp.]|uniref:VOC family protein n=1 Tax=Deinococcus sp. TaxID=47478 RepID=UPI003C7A8CD3